jgi:hypothetical protein
VFHGLDHVGLPPFFKRNRYVVTIHDVIPLLLPHTFTLRHRLVVQAALTYIQASGYGHSAIPGHQRGRPTTLSTPRGPLVVISEGCDVVWANHRSRPSQPSAPEMVSLLCTCSFLVHQSTQERDDAVQAFAQLRTQSTSIPLCVWWSLAPGWCTPGMRRTLHTWAWKTACAFQGTSMRMTSRTCIAVQYCSCFPLYEGFGLQFWRPCAVSPRRCVQRFRDP